MSLDPTPRRAPGSPGLRRSILWLSALAMLVVPNVAPALTTTYTRLSYQGELFDGGQPVNDVVKFRFAIIDASTGNPLWTNDGVMPPSNTVVLSVDNGHFEVLLGENMEPIDPTQLYEAGEPVLRVWAHLDPVVQFPDQDFAAAGWAFNSYAAGRSLGNFSAEGTIHARSGGFRFPDGTLQSTAVTSGGGGSGSLDEAYDHGGSGAGRTINADAGAVEIAGPDGLDVTGPLLAGEIASRTTNPLAVTSHLAMVDAGGNITALLDLDGDLELGLGGSGQDNGSLEIFGSATEATIRAYGTTGRIYCKILQITGGADLAEPFPVSGDGPLQPGSVVAIDPHVPGHLRVSDRAYDTRVAGIVSGAGGVNAGLTLAQEGLLDGGQNVALTGRVYVNADASTASIVPGDLLTTSTLVGHAMKASDPDRSHGAIIGKAMTGLDSGTGLVLVLVNLQ